MKMAESVTGSWWRKQIKAWWMGCGSGGAWLFLASNRSGLLVFMKQQQYLFVLAKRRWLTRFPLSSLSREFHSGGILSGVKAFLSDNSGSSSFKANNTGNIKYDFWASRKTETQLVSVEGFLEGLGDNPLFIPLFSQQEEIQWWLLTASKLFWLHQTNRRFLPERCSPHHSKERERGRPADSSSSNDRFWLFSLRCKFSRVVKNKLDSSQIRKRCLHPLSRSPFSAMTFISFWTDFAHKWSGAARPSQIADAGRRTDLPDEGRPAAAFRGTSDITLLVGALGPSRLMLCPQLTREGFELLAKVIWKAPMDPCSLALLRYGLRWGSDVHALNDI